MTAKSLQETYAPDLGCFGCGPANAHGLRLRSIKEGDVYIARWHAEPHHEAFPGMLCGGIIGTLLDCHSNWAACIHLMETRGVAHPPVTVTADYAVTLKRPTPTAGEIVVRARPIEASERRVTVQAELEAGGAVCATCLGHFVAVKADHHAAHRW